MPALRIPAECVFVERFSEPITGWEMLGVGARWASPTLAEPLAIELRLDGVPRLRVDVKHQDAGYAFGVQVPREPQAERLTAVVSSSVESVTIFDGPIASLRIRGEAVSPNARSLPRWLSPFRTLSKSVVSGDCFSVSWWAARVRRYRDLLLTTRQRLRDRWLIRHAHAPRSVHDAYVDRTSRTEFFADSTAPSAFRTQTTFSILMPVFNVAPQWLAAAIDSVRKQTYPHWQLCLADDASTDPATISFLNSLPSDPRIQLVRRPVNGHICAATNSAAEIASGEFLALMDNDDTLAPHALYAVARCLQSHPDADLIYSDEDKINAEGHRYDPQFKPDWSPDLLLSYNYINHFTVIRRGLFEKIGRFSEGLEGSQDHDVLLRLTERTDRIHHIPEILYHWRSLPTSTAGEAGVKPYVHTSGRRAVEEALRRRAVSANLYVPPFAERLGLPVLALEGADANGMPSVAIIVRGDTEAAGRTLRAIKQHTDSRCFSLYLVPAGNSPAEALNRLAAARTEDYLLFLEAGVEPTDAGWLSRMLVPFQIPGVGATGGLLRDREGRILSAGTVLGMADGTRPGPAFAGLVPEPVSYYFYAEVTRTVSAPARGCLLTRRDDFDHLGGFDTERFGQSLFDVDYALRLAGIGKRSVHVGGAELLSSGNSRLADLPSELGTLRAAYGTGPDPYYNPNLSKWDSFVPCSEAPHRIPATVADPLPVLFATHNLTAFEGAPKIIHDVALELQQRGLVRASVTAPSPGKAAAIFEAAGIPIHAEEQPFSKRFIDGQWTPSEYAAAMKHLGKVIRRSQPRVVVANTLGLFPLIEAAARQGIPAILAIQESYPDALLNRLFSPYGLRRCERAFLFAERVIFASRSCAELYRRLDGRKTFEVIHNGLASQPFDDYRNRISKADAISRMPPATGKATFRIVTIGTVCERKAQHILVEAAARLAKRRRDFVCYLVGARDGVQYLNYVEHLIVAHQLEDVVIPVNETDDVLAFLRAADAFVCTSYVEAFSLSVLEAEAFQLPIVSTPCGGLDEQVFWNRSGLRFDFGDADRLADHLEMLMRDDAARHEMGRQSRAAFDLSLSRQGMIDRYGRSILAAARQTV